MAELESDRIGFQSVTESIDTTTLGGKLVFPIFGALAEFERNLIRERTCAGLNTPLAALPAAFSRTKTVALRRAVC